MTKTQKITDTRFLKRDEQGFYYVGGSKSPCNLCAIADACPIEGVMKCSRMVPAFGFVSDVGLDDVSNTIRIGTAWAYRLQIGQYVALHSPKEGVFGYARVIHVATGNIDQMLKDHAHANHTMFDTPVEEAPQQLGRWLSQNYGPRIVNETTTLTAIYIVRDHGKDAAQIYARQEEDWAAQSGAQGVW